MMAVENLETYDRDASSWREEKAETRKSLAMSVNVDGRLAGVSSQISQSAAQMVESEATSVFEYLRSKIAETLEWRAAIIGS